MSDSIFSIIGLKTKSLLDKKLNLTGGTLTGSLILNGSPTSDNEAANKAYVDGVSQAASSIGGELDTTQAAAGLGTDGTYTANASANYLKTVTTLKAADEALDAQVFTNTSAITTINGTSTGLGTKANLSGATFTGNIAVGATGEGNGKNLDVYGSTTLHGNLTVSGSTTSVSTTNADIKDSLISLSKGAGAATVATNDAGLLIERGSDESNVAFFWDEGEDKFKFATTTGASDATDLSGASLTTDLAPIAAGNANLNDVVANTLQVGSVDLGTTSQFDAVFVEVSDESLTHDIGSWVDETYWANGFGGSTDTDVEVSPSQVLGSATFSQTVGSSPDAKFVISRGALPVSYATISDPDTEVGTAYDVTISCSDAKGLVVDDEFELISGTDTLVKFKVTSL